MGQKKWGVENTRLASLRTLQFPATILSLSLALVVSGSLLAQNKEQFSMASSSEAEQSAVAALNDFLNAWNSADIERVRATLNYPHITHGPQGLFIAQQADQFETNFEQMRRLGWERSSFGAMEVLQASENKVHIATSFSRYRDNGEVYRQGEVFYVVTKRDGHWGMQYRTPGADLLDPEIKQQLSGTIAASVASATQAIDDFFHAFNRQDNIALRELSHIPQAMLNNGLTLQANSAESSIVKMNFAALQQREDWRRSSYQNLHVINALATKVTFRLDFQRYNSADENYAIVPVVWVLTKRNERWGVEFRSLMPNSL